MKKKITVKDLRRLLAGQHFKILGRWNRTTDRSADIDKGRRDALSFCRSTAKDALELIRKSRCSVIICPDFLKFEKSDYRDKTLILVKNPRLAFIKVLKFYFFQKPIYGIHPTAVIDSRAKIHREVYIGSHTYIGKCEIGRGAIIYGNVQIYDGTKIGKRVIINAGTVIGAEGFGYDRLKSGKLERFPHLGGVIIEDDVEIGSNTSIDRAPLGNTVIGRGTKIDNLVHVAHNVIIGKHCLIIAHAMIGGSVVVGDYSRIAPSACIRDGIKIGKHATVGLGAVVTKDVPDNLTVMGCPAKPAEIYKKMLKIIDQIVETAKE